ncbi:MAG: heme NO-binding protein [Deltaproteobacteria bacterium]|nr:MAG: heme NO-binding protein [Deltaproteobacteria bacterium]
MYGLVNQAIEDLVRHEFGAETWKRIKAKAGVEVEVFIGMEAYPDEITYDLVRAASEVLGLSAAEILEAFGTYWVRYTAREGYGELFQRAGNDLRTFLGNLDNLHAHVGLSFPHLSPPSFHCTAAGDDTLILTYHSKRKGLAPMVVGLVKGLAEKFDTPIGIVQTKHRGDDVDHDEFRITLLAGRSNDQQG